VVALEYLGQRWPDKEREAGADADKSGRQVIDHTVDHTARRGVRASHRIT